MEKQIAVSARKLSRLLGKMNTVYPAVLLQPPAEDKEMHINCLELLAATLSVQTFTKGQMVLSMLLTTEGLCNPLGT